VRNALLGGYAQANVNENLPEPELGTTTLNPFDTALIDTDFDEFSIADGEFTPARPGIYLVSFSCFASGTDADAEIVISDGVVELVRAPLYMDSTDQKGSATATAIARLSTGVPIVAEISGPSLAATSVQEGTHITIARISSLSA